MLEELTALANSSSGQFIRKVAGSLVNATLAETIALSGLSDVSISSVAQGDILYYNGSGWVNLAAGTTGLILQTQGSGANPVWANVTGGTVLSVSVVTANGVSGTVATSTTTPAITLTLGAITPSAIQVSGLTASEIVITDASKNLASAAVATYPSLTELTYVKGVTSAIQTQLGLKAPLASPTFTGTVTIPTPFTIGAVSMTATGTELNYVAGVTSAIQTQITAKMTNPMTTGGDLIYGGASGVATRLANGTAGQVLQSNGTTLAPSWVAAGAGDMVLASAQTNSGIKTFLDTTMKLRNVANTFDGYFVNTNTADRIYTLPDKAMTIAGTNDKLSAFAATTSAELLGVISDETGTGALVFATSPTLTTPILGTPTSGTLTNCTGLPVAGLVALTASEIVITTAGGVLASAAVATYPSLTELTYVKGVTSAIQTQLGLKAPLASPTFTGTVTMPVGLTGVLRADTGVVSVDTDITDLVSASSLTLAGKVELATTAEINTGTDTTRAMPIDQYVASNRNVRYILYRVVEATTDTAVATTKGGDLEFPFTGTITEVGAYVDTAGTTNLTTVDINKAGTTILSTKITIDSTEKTSRTAATAPVISVSAITAGDLLTFDIDTVQTTAAKGLTLRIGIRMT